MPSLRRRHEVLVASLQPFFLEEAMHLAIPRTLFGAAVVAGLVVVPRADAEVKLLGTGVIPGTATDNTGLTRTLEDTSDPCILTNRTDRTGGLWTSPQRLA